MRETSITSPSLLKERGGLLKGYTVKTDSSPGQGVTPLVVRLLTTFGEIRTRSGCGTQTATGDPRFN